MQYVDIQGVVKTVYVERQPFKGVNNYFFDVILYKDEQEDETKDRNEVDAEPNDV